MADETLILLGNSSERTPPDNNLDKLKWKARRIHPTRQSRGGWPGRTARSFLIWLTLALTPVFQIPAAEYPRTRLAVGPFLAPSDDAIWQPITVALPDLLTVELTKQRKFELVERAHLEAALAELNLSVRRGFVATNVSRLGQLLSADWLITGSLVTADVGTNIWTKVIDMRRGVIVAVQPLLNTENDPADLAEKIASFVTHTSSQDGIQHFVGVGDFQDLSLPSHTEYRDWARRLPHLIGERLHARGVGLVERSLLQPVLDELRLGDGGFTTQARGDLVVQPAFWLVDGGYKWYRDNTNKLSVALRMERVGFRPEILHFTSASAEEMRVRIVQLIDEVIGRTNATPLAATAQEEADIHFARGNLLATNSGTIGGTMRRVAASSEERRKVQQHLENRRQAAVREFEAALLLNPSNPEIKLSLAAALQTDANPTNQRTIDLFMEVSADPRKHLAERARRGLEIARLTANKDRPLPMNVKTMENVANPGARLPSAVTNDTEISPRALALPEVVAGIRRGFTIVSDARAFWIGIDRSIVRIGKEDLQHTEIPLVPELTSPISCMAIESDALWLATVDGVVQTTKSGVRRRLIECREGFLSPLVSCMLADGDRVWLGFSDQNEGGVGYIDRRSGEFIGVMSEISLFKADEQRLSSPVQASVTFFQRTANQQLWVGTWGGLQRFDRRSGSWKTPLARPMRSGAISPNHLAVALHDNSVVLLNLNDDTWEKINVSKTFNVLKANVVGALAFHDDLLWLAGNSNLAAYDLRTKQIVFVSPLNGWRPSFLEVNHSYIWVATTERSSGNGFLERLPNPARP